MSESQQPESDSRKREIESKTQRANMEAAHENTQHLDEILKNQQQQKSSKKLLISSGNVLSVPKLGR